MILGFAASSFVAFLIDFLLWLLIAYLTKGWQYSLLVTVVGARVVSSLFNYLINRKWVFEGKSKQSVWRYYLLAIGILILNYGILYLLTGQMHSPLSSSGSIPVWAKIVTELICYPISFVMQRKFVFPPERDQLEA